MNLNPDVENNAHVISWQETFYPFDGTTPIGRANYEKGRHQISSTRWYQFEIGERSLIMPVQTSLISGNRNGLELSLSASRVGYRVTEADFFEQTRKAKLSRKKPYNGARGYFVGVNIDWYSDTVDWNGFGQKISGDDPSCMDEISVEGEVAAYFQALRCLVSGDRTLQSRGSMAAYFEQLKGDETQYEMDLLEPYSFKSFFPTETPVFASDQVERETYRDNSVKDNFIMGEGHPAFIARGLSQLGVTFTLDEAHYRKLLNTQ